MSSGVKAQAHISNLYYEPGTDGIGTVTIQPLQKRPRRERPDFPETSD